MVQKEVNCGLSWSQSADGVTYIQATTSACPAALLAQRGRILMTSVELPDVFAGILSPSAPGDPQHWAPGVGERKAIVPPPPPEPPLPSAVLSRSESPEGPPRLGHRARFAKRSYDHVTLFQRLGMGASQNGHFGLAHRVAEKIGKWDTHRSPIPSAEMTQSCSTRIRPSRMYFR